MNYELFPLSELAPGDVRATLAGATEVVVIRTHDGDVYALKDVCPHRGPKLSRGTLESIVVGERAGEYRLANDEFALRCPWHQFEYDVKTGRCLADPSLRVRRYDVAIVDGQIVIKK
jgi:nitrite reductase/ring-hydroxylating ferredoxin subunit